MTFLSDAGKFTALSRDERMQFGLGDAAMGPVQHGVIAMFGLGRWHCVNGPETSPIIESVDQFKRGVFDGLIRAP